MGNDWEMPGREDDKKKYLGKVNGYFDKHSREIHAFAEKYDFQIDKFTRGSSTWDLRCMHPKGGYFTIFIGLSDENNVVVSGIWRLDVYEKFSMYWKTKNFINYFVDEVNIEEWLEKALQEILSWKVEELEIIEREGYYKSSWSKFKNKEEWLKTYQLYPKNYPKGYEPWVKQKDAK